MVQCRLYCGLDLQGVVFMNERIKQLAIEAKLIAPEYNGFDHTRLSISQQRFAELIVQECASIASNPATGCYTSFGNDIKKHFGVEE
jgi:hypothetical protein